MEEFYAAGLHLAPPQAVQHVAAKRVQNFNYVKRLHLGGAHFFNTVKISYSDIRSCYPNSKMKKRSAHWFQLGVSLAPILRVNDPIAYARFLDLLTEEYEYETTEFARVRQMFRVTKDSGPDDPYTIERSYLETGLYTYLQTPNIPYELDYFEVVFSLCDMLSSAYLRASEIAERHPEMDVAFISAFMRIDSRFRKILDIVSTELDKLAGRIVKREITRLDPLQVGMVTAGAGNTGRGNAYDSDGADASHATGAGPLDEGSAGAGESHIIASLNRMGLDYMSGEEDDAEEDDDWAAAVAALAAQGGQDES